MRYWYDTEFHEDGSTIDLISIGIVAEDGREYYAVNRDADWGRIHEHPWLMDNVVPYLGTGERKPRRLIRSEVAAFLAHDVRSVRDVPELWAWFAAYDHVALAQLFGRMIDLPVHIPQWTNDVRQEHRRLGYPQLPPQPGGLHNALADARHVRTMHDYLEDYAQSRGIA